MTNVRSLLILAGLLGLVEVAHGQSNSLLVRPRPAEPRVPAQSVSLIQLPPPPQFQLHDIILIEVEEVTQHQPNARANRRRQAQYELQFDDLIVLLSGLRLRADQAIREEQPAVDIESLYNIQVQAQSARNDLLTFSIAAEVAEILPNGNLVIEANANVEVNNEVLSYKLSGVINPADVDPVFRSIRSERIAEKRIFLLQLGPTRDVMRRGMLLRFLDMFRIL